jgi:RHS repeat-associated protein
LIKLNKTPQPTGTASGKTLAAYYYEYQLKDHLGNVRVTFTDKDKNGIPEVQSENHYYPFGMPIGALSYTNNATTLNTIDFKNEYFYNGKEAEDDFGLGWLDYGARMYDPIVGRWWNIDPLAEQYRRLSPYNYCANDPTIITDPDGMGLVIDLPAAASESHDSQPIINALEGKSSSSAPSGGNIADSFGMPSPGGPDKHPTSVSGKAGAANNTAQNNTKPKLTYPKEKGCQPVSLVYDPIFNILLGGRLALSEILLSGGRKVLSEIVEEEVTANESANESLGANPFKDKTFSEIDEMLKSKGFTTKGIDPVRGKGSYFNPQTGTRYYLDQGGMWKNGYEGQHVDIWYNGHIYYEKVKYFLDGSPKMYTPVK